MIGDYFLPSLEIRETAPELMDLPDCDEKKLLNTVRQFTLINILFTGSRSLIKKYVITDMLKKSQKAYTFLDIGAGGCDIPIWLVKQCRKKGLSLNVVCLENDPKIIDFARARCRKYEEITVVNDDVFMPGSFDRFDYIFANHFLHHIPGEDIPGLLTKIYNKTKRALLINDIRRSRFAYFWYTIFTGLFMHNSFAFYDGRLSIKKGFLPGELKAFIRQTDLPLKVGLHSPARVYITAGR